MGRGFGKGGFGGLGDMAKLMKDMQKVQENMLKAQEDYLKHASKQHLAAALSKLWSTAKVG